MVKDNQSRPIDPHTKLSETRRRIGAQSPELFGRTYLPHIMRLPPSAMHRALFEMLQRITAGSTEPATTEGAAGADVNTTPVPGAGAGLPVVPGVGVRGARVAAAAPRGHAKSSIVTLIYALWCICYELEPFIVVASNADDQAMDALHQIKRELESNPKLIEDFPHVCEVPGERRGAPAWRKGEIITRNGVRVLAIGTGRKIRGRRHGPARPTLIIADDLENDTEVRSADQRKFLSDWFFKALLKAGTSITNVIVIGTILHYDSLLARLIDPRKSPGWTGYKYQAVTAWSEHPELWETWERIYTGAVTYQKRSGAQAAWLYFEEHQKQMLEGTEVLWPEHEGYYQLMKQRIDEGRASFDSEKQNEPLNPDECLFRPDQIQFWDGEGRYRDWKHLKRQLQGRYQVYGACDPSLGKAGRNSDPSAIVAVVRDSTSGKIYVVWADIRRRTPDELIDAIIDLGRKTRFTKFAFEANQFQEFLADELIRRSSEKGVYIPIMKIKNSTDKLGRIESLQPLISTGQLQLRSRHKQLYDQLVHFPLADHDDGPDALEMAVRCISREHGYPFYFDAEVAERELEELVEDNLWLNSPYPPINPYFPPR